MNNSVINPTFTGAPADLKPGSAAQAGPAVVSQFKGEQVSLLPTPEAVLADSMEEMTFSFSEITQKKEISERNLRSGAKTSSMEMARKYLESVPDLDQAGALNKWTRDIEQMPRPISSETLLKHAQKNFDDPSHAFLALSLAADILENEDPDSESCANAKQAKADYHALHGEAIEAGINVSQEVTKPRYTQLGKPQQLRDAYRDVVLDYESISAAYEKIAADFPGRPVSEAISFLLASLSADIHASQRDSGRSIKLQRIVSDLYQVKQLNTLHKSCERLLQRCHKLFNSKPADENGLTDRMLAFVVELKDAEWQSDRVLEKALVSTGLDEPEGNIYFLQGLKEVARSIPLKVFADKHQRERMLESMQQRIDIEVDNEAELE